MSVALIRFVTPKYLFSRLVDTLCTRLPDWFTEPLLSRLPESWFDQADLNTMTGDVWYAMKFNDEGTLNAEFFDVGSQRVADGLKRHLTLRFPNLLTDVYEKVVPACFYIGDGEETRTWVVSIVSSLTEQEWLQVKAAANKYIEIRNHYHC